MLAHPEFGPFDDRGSQRFPQPSIDYVAPELTENAPATSQIYAAAWHMAQRDHELDKLFNFEFYQGRDI